jgi:energy-coupling factor transporter ATP-binding protein EcfA2
MTIKLDVTPSPYLPISVDRQAQIIDAINAKLAIQPRQGFCFMGSPGIGKTYLMKAIRRAVENDDTGDRVAEVFPLTTLAEWQENNVARARGEVTNSPLNGISAKWIRATREENARLRNAGRPEPHYTIHYFIDEFDSQPTISAFSSSQLQTLVNACYEHAPRNRPGNEADFVQLVIAMNMSWGEFEKAVGVHVARRIAEMCVRIDFDRTTISDPVPDTNLPDAIDLAIEEMRDGVLPEYES